MILVIFFISPSVVKSDNTSPPNVIMPDCGLFSFINRDVIVLFPQPEVPTSAVIPRSLVEKLTSFNTCFSGVYEKLIFSKQMVCPSVSLILPSSGSLVSSSLKILSAAALPFIAIWKNEPSIRSGRKNSAEIIMIKKHSVSVTAPFFNFKRLSAIPSAAPPYATKSMILMEFNCIISTRIVTFLNFSASSSIFFA